MALARTDLTTWDPRASYTITVRIPDVGVRRRRFTDGVVIEDVVENMARAYLYALSLIRAYDRPETPKNVRMLLTRSRFVP